MKHIQENNTHKKKKYQTPELHVYGKLNRLTQGSGGRGNDGGGSMTMGNNGNMGMNMGMNMSDRKTKEHIVKIGSHPLGIGLYLFNYKAQFLSIGKNGYKEVNYAMLGIQLN